MQDILDFLSDAISTVIGLIILVFIGLIILFCFFAVFAATVFGLLIVYNACTIMELIIGLTLIIGSVVSLIELIGDCK